MLSKHIFKHFTVRGFKINASKIKGAHKAAIEPGEITNNDKSSVIEHDTTILQDLNKALKESIQKFKTDAKEQLKNYKNSITEFKLKLTNTKKNTVSQVSEKLENLEFENSALETKLNDYKEDGTERWELFKTKFNKDMQQLALDIKNMINHN